jgi:hypothetical protein
MTFTRRSDCAGPGFWRDAGTRVIDAAWDPSGGLHLMTDNAYYAGYAYLAPGRCVPTFPETRLVAAHIDVADNGDIRLLQFARSGALPGEITVTTIPAKPWTRDALGQTRTIIPAPSTPASDPPPLKSIDIDGELTVFYGHGLQIFAATANGETALALTNGSTFTSGHLTITDLPDGSWIIRAGKYREGLRYVDGAYEPWTAEKVTESPNPIFASVFAYDGDTLYAAWSTTPVGGYPALIVGKKVGDQWQQVTAGQGFPLALRVDKGVIDVLGFLDERGLGPMVWTHLPKFAENVWHAEYALSFDGNIDAVLPRNSAEGAKFGPAGEIFMAVEGAVWRRPKSEKEGEYYRWNQVDVTFESETDASVELPTLGERCEHVVGDETTCSFKVPTSAVFPAVVSVPGESSASNLVGGRLTPTKDSYAVVVNTNLVQNFGPTQLRLESSTRRMTPVVLGADETQTTAGTAVAYPGGFAVTRQYGGVVLSKIEAGEVVDEVELSGFEPKRLHARSGGGFALPLSQPTLAKAGVGLLSAALELEGEVPFPDGLRGYALTDDGFIGFSYDDGPNLVLAEYTEAGQATLVPSPIVETTALAAIGDGMLAFEPIDMGVAPTFTGDQSKSVWRKLGSDGVIDWTLTSQRSAKLIWNVVGGDLYVATEIGPSFVIGGETYSGVSPDGLVQYFIGRFDGATGALKAHRITSLVWVNGVAQPTAITGDAEGVLLTESFAAALTLHYVPFSTAAEPVTIDYSGDVIAGYCLQPGVQCAANDTAFAPLGNGRFGGVWTQITTTNYDGVSVPSAAKKAVAGEYNPVP